MVDYMLVKKGDVIIEDSVAVLLTEFLQCFPAYFAVVIQYCFFSLRCLNLPLLSVRTSV